MIRHREGRNLDAIRRFGLVFPRYISSEYQPSAPGPFYRKPAPRSSQFAFRDVVARLFKK
ncbi:MAG: hypothetical protein CR217_15515 [Beijerinckiaceae bacterium]|nr:MAG: hypothetical protein CR217_15515 [Beijerinckiaceae bacterium]